MTLIVNKTASAVRGGLSVDFYAAGAAGPFTYAIKPGGAGGVIDSDGHYTAPSLAEQTPDKAVDTIIVTDTDTGDTAESMVTVGPPIFLFCDIIQREMGLADGRVMLWDQKFPLPTDEGVFVAVAVESSRVIGNVNREENGLSKQFVSVAEMIGIDIFSRGPSARDRKYDILLALNSTYSRNQQSANSFRISPVPFSAKFVNLSEIDGAAIPYRFRTSINVFWAYEKTSSIDYFDSITPPDIITNP